MEGRALRLGEFFTFRPGIQLQITAQATQDSLPKANGDPGDYSKNLYLRRSRFFFGGGIGKDITYFLLLETPNLGLASLNADGSVSKNFVPFAFDDAFLDYKVNKYLSFQVGLFTLPFSHNLLQSTATYVSIDISAVSAAIIGVTQTQILRDTGVECFGPFGRLAEDQERDAEARRLFLHPAGVRRDRFQPALRHPRRVCQNLERARRPADYRTTDPRTLLHLPLRSRQAHRSPPGANAQHIRAGTGRDATD